MSTIQNSYDMCSKIKRFCFPISEKIANQIFSIPMYPYLKEDQQDQILEVLNNV